MPLYYFDVQDDVILEDETGTECADLAAARSAAIRLSGEMMRDTPEDFAAVANWIVRVRDERGCVVFSLRLQANGSSAAKSFLH